MQKLSFFACAILLPMLGGLVGCRRESSVVAVIPRTTATLLWEPMHLGAAEIAREDGFQVAWDAPADESEAGKQLHIFATAVARNCRGIVFAPDETLISRTMVLNAVRRGIPVVVVDDELGPPAGPYLSYVSNDEAAGSKLAAERVAKILHGRGSIAILGISPRLESGLSREAHFERELRAVAPEVKIAVRQFGDTVVAHQQQLAQQVMTGPQPVDAIVALTATATRGAYHAKMASTPQSPVLIVGFDQDSLLPVRSGDVDSVIVEDTRRIGQIAMRNLESRGHSAAGITLVVPLLLTRETLDSRDIQRLWEFVQYRWEQK
jgi:ribose transport system substrate-binding protein